MKLGSENTNLICSLKCDQCPSCTPGVFAPTDCLVMNAVIDAFRAQEAYWNKKREKDDLIMNDADNAFVAQEEYWKHKREDWEKRPKTGTSR